MPPSPSPIDAFCSYALADEALYQKLATHLSAFSLQGQRIVLWHRHQITGGTDWKQVRDIVLPHVNERQAYRVYRVRQSTLETLTGSPINVAKTESTDSARRYTPSM